MAAVAVEALAISAHLADGRSSKVQRIDVPVEKTLPSLMQGLATVREKISPLLDELVAEERLAGDHQDGEEDDAEEEDSDEEDGGTEKEPPLPSSPSLKRAKMPAVAVASGGAQILALVLALLGTAGAALATLLPSWQVGTGARSGALLPVWRTRGLWMDCLWYGAGGFSCGWRESPPYARAAMILSCAAGASGLCLTSLGLRCTRWGGPARSKGRAAAAAGACFAAAGALCLPPAFLLAREPPVAEYRPGGALCLASVSAAFLLAAGVVFCLPTDAGPGSARPGPSSAETGSSSARPGPPAEASPETAGALGKKGPVVDEERSENVKDSYVMQEYV